MARGKKTAKLDAAKPALQSPAFPTSSLPHDEHDAQNEDGDEVERNVAEIPKSSDNIQGTSKSGQAPRLKATTATRRGEGMATTVAKRTRQDSTEASEISEGENQVANMHRKPTMERSRDGSVELGGTSGQIPVETTNSTTSRSSIFDLPESPATSPAPETDTNRKRKRQMTTPSTIARGDRSNKRAKVTGSRSFVGNGVAPQTPSQRSPAKVTFVSAQRSRLHSSQSPVSRQSLPANSISTESSDPIDDAQGSILSDGDLRCPVCNRTFSSLGHLRRHRRSHNTRTDVSGTTGNFSQEEMDALERYREKACEDFHLSKYEFNELINWPKGSSWPNSTISKDALMASFYDVLPDRNKRSMRRYKERWFKNTSNKAHKWTLEQDRELKRLVREHGQKWVDIANLIGRTQDEVATHWYNKVQHQDKQTDGPWTAEETRNLRDAIKECKTRLGVTLGPETDHEIRWSVISDMLGNTRSRQQCSLRWRRERMKQTRAHEVRRLKEAQRARTQVAGSASQGKTPNAVASSDVDEDGLENTWFEEQQRSSSAKPSRTSLRTRRNPKVKSREYISDSDSGDVNTSSNAQRPINVDDGGNEAPGSRGEVQIMDAPDEQLEVGTDDNVQESRDHTQSTSRSDQVEKEVEQEDSTFMSEPEESTALPQSTTDSQPVSNNPFRDITKTPEKKLTQLFNATQANSSSVIGNKSARPAPITPSNRPNRPSPQVVKNSLSSVLAAKDVNQQDDESSTSDSSSEDASEDEADTSSIEANSIDRSIGPADPETDDSDDAEMEIAAAPATTDRKSNLEKDIDDGVVKEPMDAEIDSTSEESDEEVEDTQPVLFSSKISESTSEEESSEEDSSNPTKPSTSSSRSRTDSSSSEEDEDDTSSSEDDDEEEGSMERDEGDSQRWLQNVSSLASKLPRSRPSTQGMRSGSSSTSTNTSVD